MLNYPTFSIRKKNKTVDLEFLLIRDVYKRTLITILFHVLSAIYSTCADELYIGA